MGHTGIAGKGLEEGAGKRLVAVEASVMRPYLLDSQINSLHAAHRSNSLNEEISTSQTT